MKPILSRNSPPENPSGRGRPFKPMLEWLKTVISVLWVTARLVHSFVRLTEVLS